jgi:NADH-quinone oxidoreductase subunit K
VLFSQLGHSIFLLTGFIGIFGVTFICKSILHIYLSIEIFLLSVIMNFIIASLYLDDALGQVVALFLLGLAACDSAIALAILISYYQLTFKIICVTPHCLKG